MPDPGASFTGLLTHLIQLLRSAPGQEEAVRDTVALLVARVARQGAAIDAGIENSWAVDGDPLKERLQVRQVDDIQVAAGATAAELLTVIRALADDHAPIPSTAKVRVKLLPDPLPIQFSGPRDSMPHPGGGTLLPRARQGDQLAHTVEGILRELDKAILRAQWHATLHDAQAALRFIPSLSEEIRRTFGLALRRMLARPVLQALIEQAYRIPEERARTAEVLRGGGMAAAELMLEILRTSDTVGPRAFLVDALAGMPEAFQLMAPLLQSKRHSEVRLGATLLGRLGVPEAVPSLTPRVQDPDAEVRHAVIDALGHYRDKGVVEPLRQALAHPSPATRGHAARALAKRGSGAIAMPLLAALEMEKDPAAWDEVLHALAAIDAPEATQALVRIALTRKALLSFGGGHARRQVTVVRALAEAGTAASREALARIAAEGEGEVQRAAQAALGDPPPTT
ncbi:MAG: HEAT repeat domain-containing protein [Gemmatimonadales bacterium]